MTAQQEYEFALLSFWYQRAERRGDQVGMASYNRRIFALISAVYPWYYKALPETVKGE
jgi:hypothetical protein